MSGQAIINPAVAHSMSVQLERVNNDPKLLKRRIAELEAENARLIASNAALRARLEMVEGDELPAKAEPPATITPADAARKFSKSVSTINRALHDGRLGGYQESNGRWRVYADALFVPKGKGKA